MGDTRNTHLDRDLNCILGPLLKNVLNIATLHSFIVITVVTQSSGKQMHSVHWHNTHTHNTLFHQMPRTNLQHTTAINAEQERHSITTIMASPHHVLVSVGRTKFTFFTYK